MRVYEGYFHTKNQIDKPITSMHPRYGSEMQKPRAPLRITKFINSFQKLNSKWIETIINQLPENHVMRELYKRNCIFSDISVQIHYGEAVREENIAWHRDGPNSAFHVGLSIKNKRALYVRSKETKDSEYQNFGTVLEPGDVYFSTPGSVLHGVEYPEVKSYAEKIIAVQCRVLLALEDDSEEITNLQKKFFSCTDWEVVAHAISNVCSSDDFKLHVPTIHDVV